MTYDFDLLIEKINYLGEETVSKWGTMNSRQMIIHCNNFIEVSFGLKKVSFFTKLFGRFFGKVYLNYLKTLGFNINNYPKNSRTLREFKPLISNESFSNLKKKLIYNLQEINNIQSQYTTHQIYGVIESKLFKKLVYFHTSYHFNQFGVL